MRTSSTTLQKLAAAVWRICRTGKYAGSQQVTQARAGDLVSGEGTETTADVVTPYVEEVSAQCHFSSSSYFSKIFKRVVGQRPGAVRRMQFGR